MTALFEAFMHISARVTTGLAALALATMAAPTAHLATAPRPLAVDSIMRGPKLVGYPASGISTRWADEYKRILQLCERHLNSNDARRAS